MKITKKRTLRNPAGTTTYDGGAVEYKTTN